MTKTTATKRLRAFDYDKDKKTRAEVPMKGFRTPIVKGKMVRREKIEPAEPRINAGDCYHCGNPVFTSKGQIINCVLVKGKKIPTHKPCRKNNY